MTEIKSGCLYVVERLGYGFAPCSLTSLESLGRSVSAINTKSHATAVIRMCHSCLDLSLLGHFGSGIKTDLTILF